MIPWSPFSEKHKRYIKCGIRDKMSVAEGAIRSGKTIDNCIIFATCVEYSPDRIHLASGSSIANAKLNIGDCNGFGLEHLFRGRCRWGKYRDNECLYITTKSGPKIVIFAGGGKADSFKKILGNSYGIWIATEINQHYDGDDIRTSFIKTAFGRQVAAREPKVLWDLNPSDPKHKIYEEYIEKYKTQYVGGYNYEHFTIRDNLSITEDRIREIESMYDTSSIWYRRDILGERCVAEGLIYRLFADNNEKYVISRDKIQPIWFVRVGVDFGNSKSSTTFCATAFGFNFSHVTVIKTRRITRELTPVELDREFVDFIEKVNEEYPGAFVVRCDSAETTLINGLKLATIPLGYCVIKNALKIQIRERIRLVDRLISRGRLFIVDTETPMIEALNGAVWDIKKPDERLDAVGPHNPVDMLDAFEYSIEENLKDLLRSELR